MRHWGYTCGLAWRGMRGHPRTSALVVAVIALGLAACMSVLTVFHSLAANPLPGREGSVQTVLFMQPSQTPAASEALLQANLARKLVDRARDLPVAALVAGVGTVKADTAGDSTVDDVAVMAATSAIHRVFGMHLLHGRWWTAQDGHAHAPVAVVSSGLAQRLFGTDAVLGRSIRIGKMSLRVVGVRAQWRPSLKFYAQNASLYARHKAQVLVPLSVASRLDLGLQQWACPDADRITDKWKQCEISQVWAYGLDRAQRERLLDMAGVIAGRMPADAAGSNEPYRPRLMSVSDWLLVQHAVPESVRAYVWVAFAFLALCLLNAAGVLAARFMRRGSELGVRRALGASRRDVFAQHMIESGGLALTGSALALPLMAGALALLRAQTLDYAGLIHFGTGTFLALCIVTLLTGVAVGIYPAWRAAVVPPALQVKQN